MFIDIWPDAMANYTNMINIVIHARCTRLGTPQISCIVDFRA